MRARLVLVAVAAALALAACGDTESADTDTTTAEGCKLADDGRLALVAEDNRWDTDCLEGEAGPMTIEVVNRDDGTSHNVHVSDAPGSPASELERGPSTQALEVTLGAGTYEFICDLHPNMVGTLTVT